MDRGQLIDDVHAALRQAGFQAWEIGSGVKIQPVPEGVLVGWHPGLTLWPSAFNAGQHGHGVKAAMAVALRAVLEQSGYQISTSDAGLLVTWAAQLPRPAADV